MAKHLHEGFFLIGRPERHRAIMMAQVDDGIVGVLAHRIQPACLGADCRHLLSHRDVEILQKTCSALKTDTDNREIKQAEDKTSFLRTALNHFKGSGKAHAVKFA